MSQTLGRVQQLVAKDEVRISDHGYDELAADAILAGEVIAQRTTTPAVLITAYRPDPEEWTQDFKGRKP